MTERINLAGAFPRLSDEDWRALAAASIDAPDLESLVSRTDDGLAFGPIHAAASDPPLHARAAPWTIVARIDAGEAGGLAGRVRAATESGAGSIALVFDASPAARGGGLATADAGEILRALRTAGDAAPILVDAGEATAGILAELAGEGAAPAGFVCDPSATLAARGALATSLDAALAGAVAAAAGLRAGARAILADGRPWHDGGASEAEELAAVLAAFVAALRAAPAAGLGLDALAGRTGIALAADTDQFVTIAKLRAARLLVARVLEASGIAGQAPFIHAETAWRSMSRLSPHTNLIRATTAAFAAGVGGADSITVLPFAGIGDDAFGQRMAENTQLILREEANLWRLADPGAGSGAVEALTGGLAEAAWARFRTIEAGGGLFAAVRSGSLQTAVAATREARLRRVADRAIELVGVNVFAGGEAVPAPAAAAAPAVLAAPAERAEALRAVRLAAAFEAAAGGGREAGSGPAT